MKSKLALGVVMMMLIVGCSMVGCYGPDGDSVQVNTINYSQASSEQVINVSDKDWTRWRGPNGNGIAPEGQSPVTEWNETNNVLWKVRIPGRGHASPTIDGDKIFLATADKAAGTQSVLCLSRDDGKQLWSKELNQGGLRRIHQNNSYASSTISSDGERIFVLLEHHDRIHLHVFDHDGNELWKKDCGGYSPHYPFGFGASPLIHGDNVYVSGESKEGFLVAYDRKTGKEVWKIDRNRTSSYTSPIVTTIDGREMLLMSGGQQVHALDPDTGEEIWDADAKWQVSCGTLVWDGNMVFASGGFPAQQTLGINAENGQVVWQNGIKCYEQSLLAYDGFIYAVSDHKVAHCWRAKDGKEMWKEKLPVQGRTGVSASPVLANGNIYASIENGATFVFKANPQKFELVATNQLGDSAFATPTIVDSKIYARVGDGGQEWLYCIGE